MNGFLGPCPKLFEIDHAECVLLHPLVVNRQPTVFHPAYHFVTIRACAIESYDQLIQRHIIAAHQQWSKVQPRCAYLYSLLAAVQLFGESRYPANAPAFSKEGFFFSCPMAFCAFRYVCHFFVAALCAACIRAMLSGFLNISHRREWMSRSLWTRSRVFRAACSVREQINALQISGRTG